MMTEEEKRMKSRMTEEKRMKRIAARDKFEDQLQKRETHHDWRLRGFISSADILSAERYYEYPVLKRFSKQKD